MTQYPNWTPEEMILAASVAAQLDWRGVNANTPEVVELSKLLKNAKFHPKEGRGEKFRSVNSVGRKVNNLQASHPRNRREIEDGKRKGLRISKSEIPIVESFVNDAETMALIAGRIREAIFEGAEYVGLAAHLLIEADTSQEAVGEIHEGASSLLEAAEGNALTSFSIRRERDPRLRKAKILEATASGAPLQCEVCAFNFELVYGVRGTGYIEVHHRVPLHVSGETKSSLDDLALLCSNCHRMIHRKDWISVEELAWQIEK